MSNEKEFTPILQYWNILLEILNSASLKDLGYYVVFKQYLVFFSFSQYLYTGIH